MALTTVADVKEHLGITSATFDALFANLVTRVDAIVEKATGVKTGALAANIVIVDEIVDSDGTTKIRTKFHPITAVTKIEYKLANHTWAEYSQETVADVDTEDDRIYTQQLVTAAGERNLRLNYSAGYITDDVPVDLQECAILIVATLFNVRNQIGFDNTSILGLSQTMAKEDYLYVKSILTKYKQVYAV